MAATSTPHHATWHNDAHYYNYDIIMPSARPVGVAEKMRYMCVCVYVCICVSYIQLASQKRCDPKILIYSSVVEEKGRSRERRSHEKASLHTGKKSLVEVHGARFLERRRGAKGGGYVGKFCSHEV